MSVSFLRSCAGCGGSFAANDGVSDSYFCPKCRRTREEAYSPQKGALVVLLAEPRTVYVVLDVDGDDFTVRRLGFPDAASRTVRRGELDPMKRGV